MASDSQLPQYRFCPWCGSSTTHKHLDGKERVVCAKSCGFVYWDNPVPVVAALVLHKGDAILVRQHKWPAGWYGLVTGFLERDEEPRDGAAREVREELSLRVATTKWIGEYAYPKQNQVLLAYAMECEGDIVLSEELSAYKRIAARSLRPWPFGTGKAVAEWIRQQNFLDDLSSRV